MYSPTYSELKSNLQKELDLEDETFITPTEFLNYFNEGVDMVEAAIHTIYEDYFLTSSTVSLVSGTPTYSLPSDIYAQKIRLIVYNDGASKIYPIRRIKKLIETAQIYSSTDNYNYLITNDSVAGLKLKFFPTPAETNSNVTVWYVRNAKKFALDADVCDIPEFTSVIIQYVRWKCLDKEGHPATQSALADLERMKQDMVTTLTARVPDEDNEVMQDMSFYEDFDIGGF
jgi:hypothetical protein